MATPRSMAAPKRRVGRKSISTRDSSTRNMPSFPNREMNSKKGEQKAAGRLIKPVDQKSDALVKSGKSGVEPLSRSGDFHGCVLQKRYVWVFYHIALLIVYSFCIFVSCRRKIQSETDIGGNT